MERPLSSPPENLLRKTANLNVRSVYAAECYWAVKTEHLEAAMFLRGAAMTAFGYMDVKMGEIAIRLSHHAAYRGVRQTFPRTIEKRIEFFRWACDIAPQIKLIAHARFFLDRLEASLRLRHQMAHARMVVKTIGEWSHIRFDDFPHEKGNKPPKIPLGPEDILLIDFERTVRQLARLSRYGESLNHALIAWDELPSVPKN